MRTEIGCRVCNDTGEVDTDDGLMRCPGCGGQDMKPWFADEMYWMGERW